MTDIIKQHDTWPYLQFAMVDVNGDPVDCSDFTVRLLIRNRQKQVVADAILDASGSGAHWTDVGSGLGEYYWESSDTEVAGIYQYEFEFTRHVDGKVFTIPRDTYYTFTVTDDIA